jgi:hypothetical protein
MVTIGVDPGRSGAIAFVPDRSPAWCVKLSNDLSDVCQSLREAQFIEPVHAILESVHSSPQMGVKSAFSFGQSFGQCEAMLVALGIPITRVSPQRWQKDLGCLTRGDKNVTKRMAADLFPNLRVTHATADALLLGKWGKMHL